MKMPAVALLALSGCAAQHMPRQAPRASTAPFAEHELSTQAARLRARAAHEEAEGAPGMFKGVQLRAQSLQSDSFRDDGAVRSSVYVSLKRPWQMSAVAGSLREREHAATFLVDAAEAEAEARTCEESVRGRALGARNELSAQLTSLLSSVLSWVEDLRRASALDAPTTERDVLRVRRRLLEARPRPSVERVHETLGTLPDVTTARAGVLDRDVARIAEGIETAHPKVRAQLAEAERQAEISKAETRSRTPWLEFIQVGYGGLDGDAENIEGRFAIGMPLDDGARGRARRAEALREGHRVEAFAIARTLVWSAQVALGELDSFERAQDQYRELEAVAARATQLAAYMLAERRGSPDTLVQLLGEAEQARGAVLEARERAGQAACTLRFATGRSYEDWPRKAELSMPETPAALAPTAASANR